MVWLPGGMIWRGWYNAVFRVSISSAFCARLPYSVRRHRAQSNYFAHTHTQPPHLIHLLYVLYGACNENDKSFRNISASLCDPHLYIYQLILYTIIITCKREPYVGMEHNASLPETPTHTSHPAPTHSAEPTPHSKIVSRRRRVINYCRRVTFRAQ